MLNPTIAPDARLLEKQQVVEAGYGIQMAFKKNGLIPEKKFRWTSELQRRRPALCLQGVGCLCGLPSPGV